MSKLASLRQQPKSVKNQYAFGGAVVVTTIIALIWAVALPDVLSSRSPEIVADAEEQTGLTSEFFAEIGEGIANVFAAFSASSTEVMEEVTEETATSTPIPEAPTFAASSTIVQQKPVESEPPKRILIATTSVDSLESE